MGKEQFYNENKNVFLVTFRAYFLDKDIKDIFMICSFEVYYNIRCKK